VTLAHDPSMMSATIAPQPEPGATPSSQLPSVPTSRKRDPWLIVAVAVGALVTVLALVLIFLLLRGDADGSAVDCSGVGAPSDDNVVFVTLTANQPTFIVSEADELCFLRADVVLPAAGGGTVKITVDGAVVHTLDMDDLDELSGGGPEASVDLDPPMGVGGGGMIRLDRSDCDRCDGLRVHLPGIRVNGS
jgi:hypothetical protein